jgi:hypothetical protein
MTPPGNEEAAGVPRTWRDHRRARAAAERRRSAAERELDQLRRSLRRELRGVRRRGGTAAVVARSALAELGVGAITRIASALRARRGDG